MPRSENLISMIITMVLDDRWDRDFWWGFGGLYIREGLVLMDL